MTTDKTAGKKMNKSGKSPGNTVRNGMVWMITGRKLVPGFICTDCRPAVIFKYGK